MYDLREELTHNDSQRSQNKADGLLANHLAEQPASRQGASSPTQIEISQTAFSVSVSFAKPSYICCPFCSHFPYLLVCLMDPYLSFRTQLKCQLFCGSSEDEHIPPMSVMPHQDIVHQDTLLPSKLGLGMSPPHLPVDLSKIRPIFFLGLSSQPLSRRLEQRRIAS